MFYWLLKYVVVGPVMKLLFRPDVRGRANVPRSGPVILAANHLSFLDTIFTPVMVTRRVSFVAKAEYFTGRGIKGSLVRRFFLATGTIPLDRGGGEAARAALDTLLGVLRAGGVAGIFPEGTRSPDGRLHRGKTGVARLALESGAVVVPVALLNTDRLLLKGAVFPRLQRVRIQFGVPLDFSRYAGSRGDRFVERAITDEVMYELMALTGRPYVDVYAAKVKEELAAR